MARNYIETDLPTIAVVKGRGQIVQGEPTEMDVRRMNGMGVKLSSIEDEAYDRLMTEHSEKVGFNSGTITIAKVVYNPNDPTSLAVLVTEPYRLKPEAYQNGITMYDVLLEHAVSDLDRDPFDRKVVLLRSNQQYISPTLNSDEFYSIFKRQGDAYFELHCQEHGDFPMRTLFENLSEEEKEKTPLPTNVRFRSLATGSMLTNKSSDDSELIRGAFMPPKRRKGK